MLLSSNNKDESVVVSVRLCCDDKKVSIRLKNFSLFFFPHSFGQVMSRPLGVTEDRLFFNESITIKHTVILYIW